MRLYFYWGHICRMNDLLLIITGAHVTLLVILDYRFHLKWPPITSNEQLFTLKSDI